MTTSVYFNNFRSSKEQELIEDLVIESIRIYGLEMYYLPRLLANQDKIYGESTVQYFNDAYLVEFYVKTVEGFEGQGDFLSKFNIEIRDQMTLTIARRTFDSEVGSIHGLTRPQEGDLVFFPLNKKVFQIKFVEHEPVFYQIGALQMYDLKLELFEYSNEVFNTGIVEIDAITPTQSSSLTVGAIYYSQMGDNVIMSTEDGFPIIQEFYDLDVQDVISENEEIQTESDVIIDFSETDPFSESGTF